MPDENRTQERISDKLAGELVGIARCGLLVGELANRRSEWPAAFGLERVAGASQEGHAQAEALVQLVVDAVQWMPERRLAREAEAHFGTQERYRDLPYAKRLERAVLIWDPEGRYEPDSYRRREFPKIRQHLARAMVHLDGSPMKSTSRAALKDEVTKSGLRRLDCRVESWLTGPGQQAVRSDWKATDVVIRGPIRTQRSRRRSRYALHLEPLTDTVERTDNLGVDNYGYTVWETVFRHEHPEGDEFTWGTTAVYDEVYPDLIEESDWASILVPADALYPIGHASVIVHFDPRFMPERIVRFETPRATLPQLLGPTEKVTPRKGVGRAEFKNLKPGMTYGIYWWPKIPT